MITVRPTGTLLGPTGLSKATDLIHLLILFKLKNIPEEIQHTLEIRQAIKNIADLFYKDNHILKVPIEDTDK
jgi:hypothetical protein